VGKLLWRGICPSEQGKGPLGLKEISKYRDKQITYTRLLGVVRRIPNRPDFIK